MPVFQPNIQRLAAANNIEGLIKATEHLDPEMRRMAVAALGGIRDHSAYTALLRTLRDQNKGVRMESIIALGKFKEPSSISSLEWTLKDPDPVVRLNVIWALGQIGGRDVVRPLILSMGDTDKRVRMRAVDTLSNLGKVALPELRKAINGRNQLIRRNVINVLGRSEEIELVPEIIRALDDPVSYVRENAIWALGEISDPRGVPYLERLKTPKAQFSLKKIKEGPNWRKVAENYEKAGRFEDAANLYEMKSEWEEAGRLRNKAKEPSSQGFPQIMTKNLNLSQETIIKDSVISRSSIGEGEARDNVISRSSTGKGNTKDNVINRSSMGTGDGQNSIVGRNRIDDDGLENIEETLERDQRRERVRSRSTPIEIKRTSDGYIICPHCSMELKFDFSPKYCPYCSEKLNE